MTCLLLSCALLTATIVGLLDHRTGKMPNALTLSSLVLALSARGVSAGGEGLSVAVLGVLGAAGVPLVLFLLTRGGAIGGGDVKALFAIGAWLGPSLGLEVTLVSFFVLAALALGREALQGRLLSLLGRASLLALPAGLRVRLAGASSAPASELTEMRFGPSLALGTLYVCATHLLGIAP